MKTCPVVAELLHADGRTGRHDEANSRFFAIWRTRLKSEKIFFYRFLLDLRKSTGSGMFRGLVRLSFG